MTFSLRVLGSNSPFPEPGRPCSGYLITAGQTVLVMELGHAVWPELLRYSDPNRIAAVWISHLHPDHCVDLFAAYQWANNTEGARRLTVFGPPGWATRIGAALPHDDGVDRIRRVFDVREHGAGPVQVGDLTLHTVPVQHSVPTWGVRIAGRGATLAFSADSGPCAALTDLAVNADVFLCETGASEPGQRYHCTPEEATRHSGNARRLVLTHLARGLTADEAAHRANGASVAVPGMVIEVG